MLSAPVLLAGCSSGDGDKSKEASSSLISDDQTGAGNGNGVLTDGTGANGNGSGNGNSDDGVNECTGVSQAAEALGGIADVVFVIDNSSSMAGEITQVQERINDDFVKIIEASGIDYRVIMLSRYGMVGDDIGHSNNPICIRSPLGVGNCADPNSEMLQHNPGKFYHFSADMRSREGLCDILDAFNQPDELFDPNNLDGGANPRQFDWVSIAPNGFSEFLRPQAKKNFVYITDDHSRCNRQGIDFNDRETVAGGERAAQAFHDALLALSPEQFGTAAQPKYTFHSIIGMAAKPDGPDGVPPAWQPNEPIQLERCSQVGGAEGVDGNGTAFQALSIMTGGLRYPSCRNDNFDEIFKQIAGGVVAGALSCEWAIPAAPPGKALVPGLVNVRFTAGSSATAELISSAGSAANCGDQGGWYLDDPMNPKKVIVCPTTCSVFKGDMLGQVDIEFGCATKIAAPAK